MGVMLVVQLLLINIAKVHSQFDDFFADDSDLTQYITRPEIKAPLFNLKIHNADAITPGYWFVAPYAQLHNTTRLKHYYQPCQTGPHIYNGKGDLVWSGACLTQNENAFDFRSFQINGSYYLSAIYEDYGLERGMGGIMDNSFSVVGGVFNLDTQKFNMHEFNIIDNGKAALYVIHKSDLVNISGLGFAQDEGWVANSGFREVDMTTGETAFEWWAGDHVPLSASSVKISNIQGPPPSVWNFFHANSVDKNSDGDYILSSRFTDCIYKISGNDGSVIWRLGGRNSSFILEGFNFSKQHDARFIEQNDTVTVISFLDNAADDTSSTSSYSSALLVALETSVIPMKARVIQRWIRPDRKLSRLRGNFQVLSTGNAFVGWSDNAYISEYTSDGELLMEAHFKTNRFVTYRSYKFNFTGTPIEDPALKAYVFGISPETSTTVLYVSWNGATEVASWDFYGGENSVTQTDFLGNSLRTGFETMYQWNGYQRFVHAEALDKDGRYLGKSPVEVTIVPPTWKTGPKSDEHDSAKSTLREFDQQNQESQWSMRKSEL